MQRSFLEISHASVMPGALQLVASTPQGRVCQPSVFEMQYNEAIRMRRAPEDAAIARIADLALATWDAVDASLSTVIGPQAVTALYKRSLYLTRIDHPWLVAAYEEGTPLAGFTTLKNTVLRQTVADAHAALSALLQAFRNLLVGLLGESLTERLFEPVDALPFKTI